MSKAAALSPSKTSEARSAQGAGYAKGDETRRRVLAAALDAFGEDGFAAVSTRRIAQAAGVSLPVLQYYFGGKEGLYQACAEEIVERYARHMAVPAGVAAAALAAGGDAETARVHLKAVIGALTGLLVGSNEPNSWAPFAARELQDPGPAFELLYGRLWRPGVETMSRLIARIRGLPPTDPEACAQALMLISSLLAFRTGRKVAMRALNWSAIGPAELRTVNAVLAAQIDALT